MLVIEPTSQDEEPGEGRVFSEQDIILDDLSPDDQDTRPARLKRALRSAATNLLMTAYLKQIEEFSSAAALMVGAELTARGIAPVFRNIPNDDPWWKDNPEVDRIIAIADLRWIATIYPKHRPEWQRLRGIFDPCKFDRAADYALWEGRRTPGQLVKGLSLSEGQQMECHWLKCLHVARHRESMEKRRSVAAAQIRSAVQAHDRRSQSDQDATVALRLTIWECATLADWKPQRTADILKMKTGLEMPRGNVARHMEKIRQATSL